MFWVPMPVSACILYSGLDYLEYYSQFPSHNTVCVDGISSYPVMKSNHAFRVNFYAFRHRYQRKENFIRCTYSEVFFREPESCADQTRLTSIVTTGPETGYMLTYSVAVKCRVETKCMIIFITILGRRFH